MDVLIYSDLHGEQQKMPDISPSTAADVLVLAGDIINFRDPWPLKDLLHKWTRKPVIFVAGNHEYYQAGPMERAEDDFRNWLGNNMPNVHFLQNQSVRIGKVTFFGGTCWTDMNDECNHVMWTAHKQMNDYRLIEREKDVRLTPRHTVELHKKFITALKEWESDTVGERRVVVSHHAPRFHPKPIYPISNISYAFNCTDISDILEEHFFDLWVYGHTHQNYHGRYLGNPLVSNQYGYSRFRECSDFVEEGIIVKV